MFTEFYRVSSLMVDALSPTTILQLGIYMYMYVKTTHYYQLKATHSCIKFNLNNRLIECTHNNLHHIHVSAVKALLLHLSITCKLRSRHPLHVHHLLFLCFFSSPAPRTWPFCTKRIKHSGLLRIHVFYRCNALKNIKDTGVSNVVVVTTNKTKNPVAKATILSASATYQQPGWAGFLLTSDWVKQ